MKSTVLVVNGVLYLHQEFPFLLKSFDFSDSLVRVENDDDEEYHLKVNEKFASGKVLSVDSKDSYDTTFFVIDPSHVAVKTKLAFVDIDTEIEMIEGLVEVVSSHDQRCFVLIYGSEYGIITLKNGDLILVT